MNIAPRVYVALVTSLFVSECLRYSLLDDQCSGKTQQAITKVALSWAYV